MGAYGRECGERLILDRSKPKVARMHDLLLGGTDNYQADREACDELLRLAPSTRELTRRSAQLTTPVSAAGRRAAPWRRGCAILWNPLWPYWTNAQAVSLRTRRTRGGCGGVAHRRRAMPVSQPPPSWAGRIGRHRAR
ncbi:SAM-dependent methyltransferase [Streptomyces inhibens]|uniref:SAM-dependent methyltransferase n=1 Tax=Streptomyces inhibens TaxID=2293571 RepID=UPI0037BA5064